MLKLIGVDGVPGSESVDAALPNDGEKDVTLELRQRTDGVCKQVRVMFERKGDQLVASVFIPDAYLTSAPADSKEVALEDLRRELSGKGYSFS